MSTLALIFKEIRHRKLNFLVSVLAVVAAVAFFTSFFTAAQASNRETTRLMRDMGFNLRIIPAQTDMNKFWITGFSDHTMPQDYANTIASHRGLSYNHLVATLQQRISWQGLDVLLTGLAPEVCPPGQEKSPMVFEITPGTVYVGYEPAQFLQLKKGDTVDINGKLLTVAAALSETGTVDDIRIQCHLRDAQDILNLPGQINEIKAIDCLCLAPSADPLQMLRQELATLLPGAKVVQIKAVAQARSSQRLMVSRVFGVITPFVVIVCGVWIAVLAMINVRDRQQEVGIMRSLGYGSGTIASLFLGKSIVVGLLGAAAGFVAGTALAVSFGPAIFKITAKAINPHFALLFWSLVVAPAFAALCSFIPATLAATQDPADTLREA
jgi:ABC-type lipoprotein release transport system permease subunit